MAEALRQITECPVCFTNFRDPKLLPCDHSLCASCVDEIKRGSRITCPLCNTAHDVAKIRADFRLFQILDALNKKEQEVESPSQKGGSVKCELCCKNTVSHRCEDCQQWMCADCRMSHLRSKVSKKHTTTPVEKRGKDIKEKIKKYSSNVKQHFNAQSKVIEKLEAEISELETTQANALQVSDNLRQKSLKDVNDYYNYIDSQIIEFIHSNVNRLEMEKRRLSYKIQDIKTKLEKLEKIASSSEVELAVLGHAVLGDEMKFVASTAIEDVTVKEVNIKVLQGKAWNASTAAILEMSGGCEKSKKRIEVTSLSALSEKAFVNKKQFELGNFPYALRLLNNRLWSCQYHGSIQIFNMDLELQDTIRNTEWGGVCDVTEMADGSLALAGENGLFHTTITGDSISQIDSGGYNSAMFYIHKLYAYTWDSPAICAYVYSGSWKKQDTMALPFCHGTFVTLAIANDTINACSAHDNKIIRMSLTGQVLQTLGSEGSGLFGELRCPFLCQVGQNGVLLLADRDNQRLQLVDSSGHWSVVRVDPAVKKPWGAVFTNNLLYVVSRGDVFKVFMYTCK